uniref:Polysaccharide pyruvyl transferase domain-containing protein n=2 Tax=Phaeomonas parva TaxID=124430 RepID=A0A7S1XMR6_9STRA|mmetsp:Transcript_20863/g.63578  ORF Transcript_20863/g.63578 Transcript_20863/m.63578 type:complete len:282 (+) Transcript_20863:1499-2344(+)
MPRNGSVVWGQGSKKTYAELVNATAAAALAAEDPVVIFGTRGVHSATVTRVPCPGAEGGRALCVGSHPARYLGQPVIGDGALSMSLLFPELRVAAAERSGFTIAYHVRDHNKCYDFVRRVYNEWDAAQEIPQEDAATLAKCGVADAAHLHALSEKYGGLNILSMQVDGAEAAVEVVKAIAASRFVVGSSMHSVILADTYGVPSRPFLAPEAFNGQPELKYHDYYSAYSGEMRDIPGDVMRAEELGPGVTTDEPQIIAATITEKLMNGLGFLVQYLDGFISI